MSYPALEYDENFPGIQRQSYHPIKALAFSLLFSHATPSIVTSLETSLARRSVPSFVALFRRIEPSYLKSMKDTFACRFREFKSTILNFNSNLKSFRGKKEAVE